MALLHFDEEFQSPSVSDPLHCLIHSMLLNVSIRLGCTEESKFHRVRYIPFHKGK